MNKNMHVDRVIKKTNVKLFGVYRIKEKIMFFDTFLHYQEKVNCNFGIYSFSLLNIPI